MIAQLIFNSIVSGLLLTMVALGFNLIFSTTKVFHIAHGAIYISAAYIYWWLSGLGYSFLLCLSGTVIFVVLLAGLVEWLVYRPLYDKQSGQAITLISSMGVYLFLVNLVALLFGNESIILQSSLGDSLNILSLIVTPVQGIQLLMGVSVVALFMILTQSKWFLKVRGIISEDTVATVLGVNVYSIRMFAMTVGSLIAAAASILTLCDTGMDPHSGMGITLSAAVAVIIGGTGSFWGTIIASFLIAFLQTGSEWFLSAQWKEGMTFLLLIAVILWRTEGIVSFNMRVEER